MTETTLGTEIKQRREDRGLSIRRAASLAGVSEGRWRQIEKGYQTITADVRVPVHPTARTIRMIAGVLDVDPMRWLTMAGFPDASPVDDEEVAGSADDPVVAAILANRTLLPEAKAHFLNQYRLLLRLGAAPAADPADTEAEEFDAQLDADLAAQPAADEVGRKRRKRQT